jgi:hypothetical protein
MTIAGHWPILWGMADNTRWGSRPSCRNSSTFHKNIGGLSRNSLSTFPTNFAIAKTSMNECFKFGENSLTGNLEISRGRWINDQKPSSLFPSEIYHLCSFSIVDVVYKKLRLRANPRPFWKNKAHMETDPINRFLRPVSEQGQA